MKSMYSMRSPAVKRLMKEAQELREPTELYFTQPLEDNLFEWHFTIRGPENTDFDGGLYHGRIILPPEYPMKPPNVILLTPNGRFETNKKICLSISGHHPESWQPSWSIRTALLAIIGFMPTHGAGAIGSLDYPTEERKKLVKRFVQSSPGLVLGENHQTTYFEDAHMHNVYFSSNFDACDKGLRSLDWKCEHCGSVSSILKPVTEASKATKEEAKELATQINFRGEKQPTTDNNKPQTESTTSSTSSTPITTTPPNTPISTNQPFSTLPTLPGQFPMPAFPFPPFANMPNFPQQQQQGSNFVPRFPYPPQFLPSMFQHMRMPLGNPYIAGNPSCQIPGAVQTNSAVTTTVSSIQSSASSGLGESNVTNSPSSTYSGLGESNVTNSLSSSSNSYTGLGESNVINSASSPSISSSTSYAAQSDPVENASMIPPTETVRSEHDSGASATQSDTTSSAGLRQRLVDNHTTQQFREDNTYFRANAELEPEPRRSGFRLSTLLIILLLIGIVLLVLRRVYLQRMWRFPF